MQNTYLIDGYNIVHHCPTLKRIAHDDFESARDNLVDRVGRFCATVGCLARIVFDGRGRAIQTARHASGNPGVHVVFAPAHLTADTVIERHVYNAEGDRKQIIVVSGDRGIRELCRAMGALVMAPANFLATLADAQSRARSSLERQGQRPVRLFVEDRLNEASLHRLRHIRRSLGERNS